MTTFLNRLEETILTSGHTMGLYLGIMFLVSEMGFLASALNIYISYIQGVSRNVTKSARKLYDRQFWDARRGLYFCFSRGNKFCMTFMGICIEAFAVQI